MKAILLAAGLGTRLRPLTDNTPKCLVPIAGKPLLMYWFEALTQVGITEFHINTHYLADKVQQFVETLPATYNITLYHEPQLLGTLGSLSNMLDDSFFHEEPLLVAHADNLVFCDWQAFINAHRAQQNVVASMMTFDSDTPSSCGIVETDENNCLVAFHEKVKNPPSNRASGAIFLFNRALMAHISDKTEQCTDISCHLVPKLLGKVYCWHNQEYLRDIGTPESLKFAQRDMST